MVNDSKVKSASLQSTVRILNRHNQNLLTNSALGVDTIQLKAITLLLKHLKNIYRFAGVDNVKRKNSVREHSSQLLKLADFVAESLTDEADKQDLRLLALIHDYGELAGEVTVANDIFNGNKVIADKYKEAFETDIFTIFMNLAITAVKEDDATMFETTLNSMRKLVDNSEDMVVETKEYRDLLRSNLQKHPEFTRLLQTFLGTKNKMMYIFLKTIDRAEGTNYLCSYGEDLDLLSKEHVQQAIEYNMSSLYVKLPKNLGGNEDYISTFKKVKSIVKAAVRRYKHLCRFDKLSWVDTVISNINDSIGRYVTWGPDEYVYYIKYWSISELYKVFTGEYTKIYKTLEEIYNDK